MKGLAIVCGAIRSGHRPGTLTLLAVTLGLAVWPLGVCPSIAETRSWPRIIENPATTLRTLDAGESGGPVSEEIWIISDDPAPATTLPSDEKTTQVEPASQARANPITPNLSSTPKAPNLATAFLKFRASEAPREEPEVKPEKRSAAHGQAPLKDELGAAKPAVNAGVQPMPEADSAQQAQSPPPTVSSEKAEASETLLALSECLKADRPESPESKEPKALTTQVEEGDDAMFHTTSTPVKPAALVFRPTLKPERSGVVPASPENPQAELQVPSSPTAEPDVKPRLMNDPSILNVRAGSTIGRGGSPSVVRSNAPAALGPAGNRTSQPPPPNVPRPKLPGTRPADAARGPGVQHVILRVKLAELSRSSAGQWHLTGLDFSRRPPLLRSLLEAGTGTGAILLDSLALDEIESELESLQHRGSLRMQSQPTLVTASGRAAKFVTGAGPAGSTTDRGNESPAGINDLQADVTLLPVVTEQDHIQLEVTCKSSRPDSEAGADDSPALATQASTTKVQMRAGQTLAIGGLGQDSNQDDQQHPLTVARMLGFNKAQEKQTRLVMLVTPELIRSPQSEKATSAESRDVSRPDQTAPVLRTSLISRWGLSPPKAGR